MFIIYQSHELYTHSFLCPPGSEINYKISNMCITHFLCPQSKPGSEINYKISNMCITH